MRELSIERIGIDRLIDGRFALCDYMLSFREVDYHPVHDGSSVWIFRVIDKWWILPRTNFDKILQAGPFDSPSDALVHLKLISE
jgi:hypothetical protein